MNVAGQTENRWGIGYVESSGIKYGVNFAAEMGFYELEVETDSRENARTLQSSLRSSSYFGFIIQDCLCLASHFQEICFSHMKELCLFN